jgi:hypothetical protein
MDIKGFMSDFGNKSWKYYLKQNIIEKFLEKKKQIFKFSKNCNIATVINFYIGADIHVHILPKIFRCPSCDCHIKCAHNYGEQHLNEVLC